MKKTRIGRRESVYVSHASTHGVFLLTVENGSIIQTMLFGKDLGPPEKVKYLNYDLIFLPTCHDKWPSFAMGKYCSHKTIFPATNQAKINKQADRGR